MTAPRKDQAAGLPAIPGAARPRRPARTCERWDAQPRNRSSSHSSTPNRKGQNSVSYPPPRVITGSAPPRPLWQRRDRPPAQASSSDQSPQSFSRSHLHRLGMQRPFSHRNWKWREQLGASVGFSGENTASVWAPHQHEREAVTYTQPPPHRIQGSRLPPGALGSFWDPVGDTLRQSPPSRTRLRGL